MDYYYDPYENYNVPYSYPTFDDAIDYTMTRQQQTPQHYPPRPCRPGQHWVPGHWERRWIPGRWGRRWIPAHCEY